MAKPNGEYWARRFEILEVANHRNAGKANAEIEREFTRAQKTVETQIEAWYSRFATNNQITLAEARQWITGKDLAEFKWSVDDFIRYGKEAAVDPALVRQLENASARFHISKLDALKAQTQMSLERLYGTTESQTTATIKQTYLDSFYHSGFALQEGFRVGWDMTALNENQLESVLSKPWTIDKETFSDRLWKQKRALIDEVHTQLTQNMILGKTPDDAINAIAKKFNTSKQNAGRMVMTESAHFANLAQKNAFADLGVEEYEVVVSLDELTCPICGAFDGQHFPMSQWEVGVTAPIYHPRCRCCTAPYFNDMERERFARGEDGTAYYIPSDMTYPEWKEKFVDGGDKDRLKAVQQKNVPEPTEKEKTASNGLTERGGSGIMGVGRDVTSDLLPRTPDIDLTVNGDGSVTDNEATRAINGQSREMAMGMRKPPSTILTDEDIQSLREDIRAIQADERVFTFNSKLAIGTSYHDDSELIMVRGNVLPDLESGSTHPRDLMSSRAVLAHEYYGHRENRNNPLPAREWQDEYRASYDAAKNAPGLSDEDRRYLILDAIERKKEAGINIEYDEFMRSVLYGYVED